MTRGISVILGTFAPGCHSAKGLKIISLDASFI